MISPFNAVSPNPDVYLNHLTPQEAFEYESTRNILLIVLGASIWDTLATIPDDLKVLRRSRFTSTTFCFVFARYFAIVGQAISNFIRRTAPTSHTHLAVITGTILNGISFGCSSYLFLQRIRAVYADSPRVRQFFTVFWMASLLSESSLVFSIKTTYIPDTEHFKDAGITPLMSLIFFSAVAFDSSVFLAISYKIGIAHVVIDREMGWKRFITGKALPRLSQAVLRGGQQYYLIVCLVILPSTIILYVPSTPTPFKSMFTVSLIPLMASMSCRVYRNIKLFDYDTSTPYPISEIQFV